MRLDPESIEAIAQRVVELLQREPLTTGSLIDAAQVAERLGVSRDWVYRHQDRLGAIRVEGRLRFNPAVIAEQLDAAEQPPPPAPAPRRHRRLAPGAVELLPVGSTTTTTRRSANGDR